MIFNFEPSSLAIVLIFLAFGITPFIMSIPYLKSKEVLRDQNNEDVEDASGEE